MYMIATNISTRKTISSKDHTMMGPMSFVAALTKAGFEPRFRDREFIMSTRVIPVVHRISALPIDIVLAGPGLEPGVGRRRDPVQQRGLVGDVGKPGIDDAGRVAG